MFIFEYNFKENNYILIWVVQLFISAAISWDFLNMLLEVHKNITLTILSMAFYSVGHLILWSALWENTQHKHTMIQPPTIPRPVSRSQANSSSDLTVLISVKSEAIYTNLAMEV